MLIVSDSLVSNLSRSPKTWRKDFINNWALNNLYFSSNLKIKYIFIISGTNNIDRNSPQSIANTIISTGLAIQKKCHKFQAVIIPLLLRL